MYVKVRALKDFDSGATQGEQGRRSSRKKKEREKVKVKENRKKKKSQDEVVDKFDLWESKQA